MHATGLLALCLMAGCYSTPQPDCGFVCSRDGECPADYQCGSDNRCHRNGTPASLVCGVDAAPPPIDAAEGLDAPDGAAPDVTAPTLVSTVPADMATNISRTPVITVVFSEAVTGVDMTSFTAAIGANAITGVVSATDTTTYNFTPSNMLMPNATVTVSFAGTITDGVGNTLAPTTFSFMTGN